MTWPCAKPKAASSQGLEHAAPSKMAGLQHPVLVDQRCVAALVTQASWFNLQAFVCFGPYYRLLRPQVTHLVTDDFIEALLTI